METGRGKILHIVKGKSIEIEEKKKDIKKNNSQSRTSFYSMLSLAWDLGFSISLPIVGGALLGQFLDRRLETTPRITLSLIFLGIIVASANIYLVLKKVSRE